MLIRNFSLHSMTRVAVMAAALAVTAFGAENELLPDGDGKTEVAQNCATCHDLGKAVSVRQDRAGWGATLLKMVGFGMKSSDEELRTMLAYLETHFQPEELPPVNVNTARAIELESRLTLKRSEASAILKYRAAHGKFESIDDLLKVPGIDAAKIQDKRDWITF